jgi:sulfate adenylyltransferase subunit 1 (EFTu-like GTPase family)
MTAPSETRAISHLAEPIFADAYRTSRATGSAILIDEATNDTVGAVLVRDPGEGWP